MVNFVQYVQSESIITCNESKLRPGLNGVGRADENNSVGAQGRQDKIGQEMFTYKVPNSSKQSEVATSNKNKVWKRHDRKGEEKNTNIVTKGESNGGKRSFEECGQGDIMDIDNVKKLKDNCDSNLTASVTSQHRRIK